MYIPDWYRELVLLARTHENNQWLPILQPAPKPLDGYGWVARAAVLAELRNPVDTHGFEVTTED